MINSKLFALRFLSKQSKAPLHKWKFNFGEKIMSCSSSMKTLTCTRKLDKNKNNTNQFWKGHFQKTFKFCGTDKATYLF